MRVLSRGPESDQAARRPGKPEVGEPQLERRRPVLLVGPRLQLAWPGQRKQCVLPGAAPVAARQPRHLARLDRQHQQSQDHERGLLPRPAHGTREKVGQRDAERRRPEEQADQRFRACRRSARAVLHPAKHGVHPTRAEGRRRFGGGARRAEPCLYQHRRLQRGVAASFSSADRWHPEDFADQTRGRSETFGVLAGDRGTDDQHGAVPAGQHVAALPAGRTWWHRHISLPTTRH